MTALLAVLPRDAAVLMALPRVLSKPELRAVRPPRTEFLSQPRHPITMVLDGVSGSYNIGALFRLCDAFLVERLVICGRRNRGNATERATPLERKRKLVQLRHGHAALGPI